MAKQTAEDKKILASLIEAGGKRVQDDALVFEGDKFVFPKQYENRFGKIREFIDNYEAEQNAEHRMSRSYDYHPYDVANAFQAVLKGIFGTSGFGKATVSMFSSTPPEIKTVRVSTVETIQIPWGKVELPTLEGTFDVGYDYDRTSLPVGRLVFDGPKKHRDAVDGLFHLIGVQVTKGSIYRGKAIDAEWMDPEFLDVTSIDEREVAYSAEVLRQLEANIWTVIRHANKLTSLGMPLKRAVLLHGPFGTGKSLTGKLTAKKAVADGWTFIYCKPGQNINQAMHAARLLAPAVVFFEDLDVIATPGTEEQADQISKLLDTFDGIANKGQPVIAVMTTNYVERLHKGMLRPGRLDALVEIGHLDVEGTRKIVSTTITENLAPDVDWGTVHESMEEFLPAFVKEAATRAVRYSLARSNGKLDLITTDDLVGAAQSLRPQLEMMNGAADGKKLPELDAALQLQVQRAVNGAKLVDADGDPFYGGVTVEAGQ